MPTSAPLRLRTAAVTVLLGPADARREVLDALDPSSARCGAGHGAPARRLVCRPGQPSDERVRALAELADDGCALVLADGLASGLDAPGRRCVLDALRALSRTGVAVLVDDDDPVAVLAVADAALRVGADGSLQADDLQPVL